MRTQFTLLALAGTLILAGCVGTSQQVAAPTEPAATVQEPITAPTTAPMATEVPAATGAALGTTTFVIDPAQSKVTYEVGETFFREGTRFAIAIGTTNTLSGEIMVDPANPASSQVGPLTVDISQFKSDSDRRDQRIREEWLESAKFPTVTFQPTAITGLPSTSATGGVTFQVTGDATIRDTTKPLTFDVTASLDGDKLVGQATTQFKMTDFGFQPPDIAGMLKAEDDVKITVDFVAVPK